jgi:hypothetical protein
VRSPWSETALVRVIFFRKPRWLKTRAAAQPEASGPRVIKKLAGIFFEERKVARRGAPSANPR